MPTHSNVATLRHTTLFPYLHSQQCRHIIYNVKIGLSFSTCFGNTSALRQLHNSSLRFFCFFVLFLFEWDHSLSACDGLSAGWLNRSLADRCITCWVSEFVWYCVDERVRNIYITCQGQVDDRVRNIYVTCQGHVDDRVKNIYVTCQWLVDDRIRIIYVTCQGQVNDRARNIYIICQDKWATE